MVKTKETRNGALRAAPSSAPWPPRWSREAPPGPTPAVEPAPPTPEPPSASTWRRPSALGHWPIPWRQRWAARCDELEAEGIPYPDHERQAFEETARRVDPDALRDLDRPAPPPAETPIELDDSIFFDLYDPHFGVCQVRLVGRRV